MINPEFAVAICCGLKILATTHTAKSGFYRKLPEASLRCLLQNPGLTLGFSAPVNQIV